MDIPEAGVLFDGGGKERTDVGAPRPCDCGDNCDCGWIEILIDSGAADIGDCDAGWPTAAEFDIPTGTGAGGGGLGCVVKGCLPIPAPTGDCRP